MWVQLKTVQHVYHDGKMRTFYPGDWVEVGRQQAMVWVASGQAVVYGEQQNALMPPDSGVLVRAPLADHAYIAENFGKEFVGEYDGTPLEFSRSLIWKPPAALRLELVPIGMNLLEKWDAAVPLFSYPTLAKDIGKVDERRATEEQIVDLRVPFYHTGLIYVRRSTAGQDLMSEWSRECERFKQADERLAFLRAMFTVKPRLCALPTTWHNKDATKGRPR